MNRAVRAVKLLRGASHYLVRDPASSLLLVRLAFSVVWLTALIRALPLPRALALFSVRKRAVTPPDVDVTTKRLARALDRLLAADFWVFTPTCWKRAPVLQRYLAIEGIETRVRFGVRTGDGQPLDGHAWLESDGRPILESTPPDYKVIYTFPA